MKIQTLNKISPVGLKRLGADYVVGDNVEAADAILVRSAVMHDMTFDPALKAIARAGAGVNNIPVDRCADEGIVVFNTPGANANGVKELTVCALLLASRDITAGAAWAATLTGDVAKQVEKGKSQFAGYEIAGKTLGVVGLGAIGGMVANTALALGMNVIGCDPFLSVDAAWHMSPAVQKVASYDEIFEKADYITLHVPATPQTTKMINAESIAKMKDGVRIVNLARADLVDAAALKEALAAGKVARYVTDFPTDEVVNVPNIIAIPHLGASTEEAEDNCAAMAADELVAYLEKGNIRNSVNYPNLFMPCGAAHKVLVLHKNAPNAIASITGVFGKDNINIENMVNASKKDYAATAVETNAVVSDAFLADIKALDGVIRVINVY